MPTLYRVYRVELHFYRPQRSCGQGNVFTGVCLSTGGRVSASVHAGMPYPPGTRETPLGPGRPPPGPGRPPGTRQTPSGPGRPPREADSSIRSTSGRYASYWNTFLLAGFFSHFVGNFAVNHMLIPCFCMKII